MPPPPRAAWYGCPSGVEPVTRDIVRHGGRYQTAQVFTALRAFADLARGNRHGWHWDALHLVLVFQVDARPSEHRDLRQAFDFFRAMPARELLVLVCADQDIDLAVAALGTQCL